VSQDPNQSSAPQSPDVEKSEAPSQRKAARGEYSDDPNAYPLDDTRPDLIFGLVCPIGADLERVKRVVSQHLNRFGYQPRVIKLTSEMRALPHPYWSSLSEDVFRDRRYELFMDAGDCLRAFMERKDAMAMLAVLRLQEHHEQAAASRIEQRQRGEVPAADHCGFIIDSLKTPEEVDLLRSIYGDRFIVISVYAPAEDRRTTLARRIAESHHTHKADDWLPKAMDLILRDQHDPENEWGQNVAKAFPMADIFLDASNPMQVEHELHRAFDLLFDNRFITPTPAEYAMALAQTAAMRSADLSRQIGAVIVGGASHSVIAVGCNDVPRSKGGQYWPGGPEIRDVRDFRLGEDASRKRRDTVFEDVERSLLEDGWVPPGKSREEMPQAPGKNASKAEESAYQEQLHKLVVAGVKGKHRRLLVDDIIEFARAVHAEMAAITDAAMRGVSVADCELYSTTFPCHECARHIVSVGIREVQYIEPYPKSLVADAYSDSIAIDGDGSDGRVHFHTFVGIAPRRFNSFFAAGNLRQDQDRPGELRLWDEKIARPRAEIFGVPHGTTLTEAAFRRSQYQATIFREATAAVAFLPDFEHRTQTRKGGCWDSGST
jgi:deoxycytidylate deaminase